MGLLTIAYVIIVLATVYGCTRASVDWQDTSWSPQWTMVMVCGAGLFVMQFIHSLVGGDLSDKAAGFWHLEWVFFSLYLVNWWLLLSETSSVHTD